MPSSIASSVGQAVNKKAPVLAPFTLQVESRYLNPTMPSREDGDRRTNYGYDTTSTS